jgi:hypothetical protein
MCFFVDSLREIIRDTYTFSANISKYVSAIFVSELDAPSGPWIDFFDAFDRNEALEGLLCDELLEFEEDTDDREARFPINKNQY